MLRSLIFFWQRNLAVASGAAIATAVLTGALIVGDSMRSSLENLTLDRLGEVDYALTSENLFGEDFASRLSGDPLFADHFDQSVPALTLLGSAIHSGSDARASAVNIYGVDQKFASLFPDDPMSGKLDLVRKPGQLFPSVIINESLSDELGAQAGDAVLLSYHRLSTVPGASLLGSRESSDNLDSLRLTVSQILPDRQLGRFGLRTRQHLPLNAFVALDVLQDSLHLGDKVNSLLVSGLGSVAAISGQPSPQSERLKELVAKSLTIDDVGIQIDTQHQGGILESREFVLRPQVVQAALAAANQANLKVLPVITYLANSIRIGERSLPYSTVSALPSQVYANFEAVEEDSIDGQKNISSGEKGSFGDLADNEILLNQWAADDLSATVGDQLALEYYVVDGNDELETSSSEFRVAGIVKMVGLAGDPELTPAYPGISDSADMSDWDPPFPVDLSAIRPKDEDYWDLHQATPKAFVTATAGSKLWSSRFGELTSLRIEFPIDSDIPSGIEHFQENFLTAINPASFGLEFRAVKSQGLAAARGATDFTGLFLGFSLFLIASSAILVGLLFSLNVERRITEIGLRLAIGFPLKIVRTQLLVEGGIVAVIGSLAGTVLAIGYAQWLIGSLGSWWSALIDSPFLELDINFRTLAGGFGGSMLLVLVVIWWTTRRLTQNSSSALLAGITTDSPSQVKSHRKNRSKMLGWFCTMSAVGLIIASFVLQSQAPSLFFGAGGLLCGAGISFFAVWCRGVGKVGRFSRLPALLQIVMRSSARSPGRSLLSVALVSSACFVLVSLGANRHGATSSTHSTASGTGGFSLIAGTDIPISSIQHFRQALSSQSGSEARAGLDLRDSSSVAIYPMRLLPGEDASCLNLYQPEKPRVLGVTPDFIARGGFQFQQVAHSLENPWELLLGSAEPGVIPAIADYNSALWILHLGLGKDLQLQDGHGNTIKLRLVGLLKTSVFQSEILISETNFLKHFPDHAGYRHFLLDVPEDTIETASRSLEANLSDYGLDTTSSDTKLAGFQAVENMYLKTFEVLGALGLLLGTVGLGVVVIRNLIERRGELAAMRAFGFRRYAVTAIVLLENTFLLVIGIGIGTLSGLAAVAPHLLSAGSQVPWGSLAVTLASVLGVGMVASAVGVLTQQRVPLLPVLKNEGLGA